MGQPLPLRSDFDAATLLRLARRSKDAAQSRRLLALAAIYDGALRSEAARLGSVTLQILRDWVLRFNAAGPEGSGSQGAWRASAVDGHAACRAGGDDRGRTDPGDPRLGAL